MAYTVEVIRSRRRSLSLELKPDGSLLVRAPMRTGMPVIRAFVSEHGDWIEKQRKKQLAAAAVSKLTEEELSVLRRAAEEQIPARTAFFAPQVGVRYGRITIRCQKTKWGSCSSKGNLNFNLLLMLAPPEVVDYVVVHELCHRLEMNHSERFWANVGRVLPDYGRARSWLKKHGGELMARVDH